MEGIKEFTYQELRERHRMTDIQIKEAPFCPADFPKDKPKQINPQQLIMLGEFFKINKAFNDAGIKAINLKGPLLSYKLYGDWGARHSKDLDILVNKEEIDKAVSILEEMGYQALYKIPSTPKKRKLFLKSIHHVVYNHPLKRTQIELHWQILGIIFCSEKTIQKTIKENTVISNYQGYTFHEFTPELELTYLVMHGAKHAWSRLKWLCDIDKYLKTSKIETNKLVNIAKKLGAKHSYSITSCILNSFYNNSKIIDRIKTKPSPHSITYCLNSIVDKKNKNSLIKSISTMRYNYLLSNNNFYGIKTLFQKYKISEADIANINLPDKLTPFYHLIRITSWTRRHCIRYVCKK